VQALGGGVAVDTVQALGGGVAVDTNRGLYYTVGGADVFNPIGVPHTFIVRLEIDYGDGEGFVPAPEGTTGFGLSVTGMGTITAQTCNDPPGPGTDGNGECTVVISPIDPTEVGTASLTANWSGTIDVEGIPVVIGDELSANLTANQDSAVKEWRAGSISIFKHVEVNSQTPLGSEVCFTLSRTDGTLITTSSNPQCISLGSEDVVHLFRWEGLTAGTYSLAETTVPDGYTPIDPFTDIVVDDANRDWLLRTVQNLAPPVPPSPAQGCTPGYWKAEQHWDSWVGYAPTDALSSVFDVSEFENVWVKLDKSDSSDKTPRIKIGDANLGQALRFNGSGAAGLLRAAVAAVLNGTHPEVNYPYSAQEVIDLVNSALDAGEPDIGDLAGELDDLNNSGSCPLN
jgi:hypothetical protein